MVEAAKGWTTPDGEEEIGSKSGVPGGDESIGSNPGEDGGDDGGELGADDMEEREELVARLKTRPQPGR